MLLFLNTRTGFHCHDGTGDGSTSGGVIWYEREFTSLYFYYHSSVYTSLADQPPGRTSIRVLCDVRGICRCCNISCLGSFAQVRSFNQNHLFGSPDLVTSRRLAKIRRVGLSNSQNSKKSSKPWLPLPLRRRTPDGWS